MRELTLKDNERQALMSLKEALSKKIVLLDYRLFGSKARGDASPDSDIDIMIEVDDYNHEVESLIDHLTFDTNLKYDCFITTIIFGRKELEEGSLGESPVYKAIEREGIRV